MRVKEEGKTRSLNKYMALILFLVFSITVPAFSQQAEAGDDETLFPYFFVYSDDPTVDQLPLQSMHAEVEIAGESAR